MGVYSFATWNILTPWPGDGEFPPQSERVGSFATALANAGPDEFSAVSLYEVELDADNNSNGLEVVKGLSLPNHGTAYNEKNNEGLFMASADNWSIPEAFVLDPNHAGQAALTTTHDDITAIGSIWSFEVSQRKARLAQSAATLGKVAGSHSVIMSDFNCLRFQKPRRMIKEFGHTSLMSELGLPRPRITFPTQEYRHKTVRWYQQPLVGRGYSLDDIYISPGLEMVDGGRLKGESDHYGLWVTVRKKSDA